MLTKKLEEFKENGFCVLENVFNASQLEKIRSDISEVLKNEVPHLKGKDVNYIEGQVNSVHCLHLFLDKYFSTIQEPGILQEFCGMALQDEPDLRKMELFAKPPKVGLPSPMHQDDYYWCLSGHNGLTVWIALDAANISNGGVAYLKGSQKLGLVAHTDSFAPGSSQKVESQELLDSFQSKKEIPEIQPGDCLIHHCLTIHGSGANQSNLPRRGLTLQMKGKKTTYDLARLKHYEERLNLQLKARNQI